MLHEIGKYVGCQLIIIVRWCIKLSDTYIMTPNDYSVQSSTLILLTLNYSRTHQRQVSCKIKHKLIKYLHKSIDTKIFLLYTQFCDHTMKPTQNRSHALGTIHVYHAFVRSLLAQLEEAGLTFGVQPFTISPLIIVIAHFLSIHSPVDV